MSYRYLMWQCHVWQTARSGALGLIAITAACSSATTVPLTGSAEVGSDGGTVLASGAEVDVPPGALATTITIAITADDSAMPAGYTLSSPVFHFSPDGMTFDQPVTISLQATTADASAHIFWSRTSDPGYEELGTTWQGTTATAQVSHFGSGFVGSSLEAP